MNLFNNIYYQKKILITGDTGFKGSWLALWLKKLGADVYGYSLPGTANDFHYRLLELNYPSERLDINNSNELNNYISKSKPDFIFHLAAQSLVIESYKNPLNNFTTNVSGTLNILECIRTNESVKGALIVTTDKVYKNNNSGIPFVETDAMGANDPYSASKACADLITQSYISSLFKNQFVASVRSGNVIGGGDMSDDRIVPDIIRSKFENKDLIIRNPYSIRPWQHVLETINGYLTLGEKLLNGDSSFVGEWNFGPNENETYSVKDILSEAENILGSINSTVEPNLQHKESSLLKLNSSKAFEKLKWKNVLSFKETASLTFSWYKDFYIAKTINSEKDLNYFINKYYEV
jgi:CDP-glucose 4,6-dehydratase